MKKLVCLLLLTQMYVANVWAQAGNVGIATVTPNSKLQVEGSIALGYRTISASSALTVDDYAVEFTGVTDDSITLPNATACAGRVYVIKNTSPVTRAVARIVPIMGQMIDGSTDNYMIYGHNEAITLTSNGSDWIVSGAVKLIGGSPVDGYVLVSDSLGQGYWSSASAAHLTGMDPGTAAGNTTFWDGSTWVLDNNNIYNAGTTVGIGTSTFDGDNPEKLVVDAGVTSSVNAIVGKGSINSYLQLNIHNSSSGTSASSDVVATADNGDETTNYIDMGINGSGNTSGVMGDANDAYLYNMGENMLIGTGSASKSVVFLTGGVDQTSNERMRIDGSGNVGIGTTSPTNKLDVNGALGLGESGTTNGSVVLSNNSNSNKVTINSGTTSSSYSMTLPAAQGDASSVLTNDGSGGLTWGSTTNTAWGLTGNAGTNFSTNFIGTTDSNSLRFRTSDVERFVIDSIGNARFGTATTVPNTVNPEKFLVDAGVTESVNAIVGKGTINSYLQLNIQNFSNGTSASSDIVATADNGDETNNYIDMGINGSGNSNNVMGQANDAYIFNVGQDLLIGTSTASKSIEFLTGGTDESANERMRIDGSGNVGIATTTPAYPLDVNGTIHTGKSTTTNGAIVYSNSTNNRTVTLQSGITSASYGMTLPVAQGAAGTVLSNDGSGVLSWIAPDSGPTGATGATGATGETGIDGGNAGKLFYLDYTDASDIGGYKVALASPSTNSESNLSQSNSGTSDNLVATFATAAGEPGVTALPYGISELNLYANTNNASRFARLKLEIYKRTSGGVETLVTSGYSSSFSNTSTAKITWTITEAYAYTLTTTDRLVFKLYTARVSGTSPVTVSVYFEGSSNASYLRTTISAGAVGPSGAAGANGATGATGANGATGAVGATGATGAAGADGDRYATTSATSFNIPAAAASATFTVATGLSYSVGQSVVVASTATPTDLFHGSVTSYNSGTGSMTVLCASATGAGNTYSSWTANLDGTVGAAGATGATGAAGSNGSAGATGPTGANGSNGSAGATGATGATGAAGAAGADGADGATGATGADGSTDAWGKTGTSGTSSTTNFIGTTDSRSFRVRTNNTQRMVVDSLGRVAIGSTSTALDASNPEKLLVDAGTTSSVNAIAATGTINNYFQMNIQNLSSGTAASSDIVATADNGDESNNFIDMGINGSGNTSAVMGGADDAYIYNVGGDMYMGAGTASKSYIFLTGGTDPVTNERMRINGSGNVGIGNASPGYKLDVNGTIGIGKSSTTNGVLVFKNNSNSNTLTINSGTTSTSYSLTLPTAQGAANSILTNNGSGVLSWGSATGTSWGLTGNSGTAYATNFIGTTDSKSLRFRTNNTERFVIDSTGNVRVGSSTTTLDATHPQKFLVDAGTTTSQIAAAAKGSINNNLQVSIQNTSNGTAAASNFVATADNGTISTNLLNMGINGSGNTSTVFGGAGDGHVYTLGQDLLIGTGTAAKVIQFLTGGTSESTNERMRIDGSGNVGIGTASPGSKLDVKGTLRLSGSTSGYVAFAPAAAAGGTTYTLPSADGTSGQALTTNGSGTLAWGSVASPTLIVAAARTSAYTPSSSYTTLAYNSATTNVGSAYNTTTGEFTAPATGLYQILVNNSYYTGSATNNWVVARVVVNGSTETETTLAITPYSGNTYSTLVSNTIVSMTSGQTASISIGGESGTMNATVSSTQHTLKIIRLN